MKSRVLTIVAIITLVAMPLWYINTQITSIKYHSFSVGCLDVKGMTPVKCHSLAERYVSGTL